MDHVAIMKKSWGLTPKILSGKKKIESRWCQMRCSPWGKIAARDTVYFKDSGHPAEIKAEVSKVLAFSDLTPGKVQNILDEYAEADGIEKDKIPEFFELFKNKKYCLLVFLENPQRIEPFEIDKSGFGCMSAWIAIENIEKIKLPAPTLAYERK
jgi:hypothetical protein